jgi:uncharacterized protein
MPIRRKATPSTNGNGQVAKATGNGHAATSVQALAASTAPPTLPPSAVSAFSTPLDRARWARTVGGDTFAGLRNTDIALGYQPSPLLIGDYRRRYRRGGIAAKLIEAFPLATWSSDARLTEDADSTKDTPFEFAASQLFDRLDIWAKLTRADILANLGHYSVILIGDGTDITRPLPTKLKRILYLTPYAEDNATISKWDEDTKSERYGQPLEYQINVGALEFGLNVGSRPKSKTTTVHWSRILHIADGLLENEVFGRPRLEAVWNYLDDLTKIVGGGAEAAWKRMDPGMQLDLDPEMEVDAKEILAMEEQVDEYMHNLRRVLQTRGTKLNLLSTTVAGFGPNAASVLDLICGTVGVPQRILLGSEMGQLASTQDRDNWGDRVKERRRGFATPLIRQFVDRMIDCGVLPTPKGQQTDDVLPTGKYQYVVTWPEVGPLDSAKTAEVLAKVATANLQHAQAGGGLLFTADEIRHHVVGLGPAPPETKVPYGKSASTPATDGSQGRPAPTNGGAAST